jgi:transcriptional regulator with XRE-family HTH domain
MPAPKNIDPYESPLAFFGAAVRRHRLRLGLTQNQLGKQMNYSEDTISKIETGETVPTIEFGTACDREFGTHEDMAHLAKMVRKLEAHPVWLRPWVDAEREARKLRSWEPLIVDGLLQIEEYARHLLRRRPGATDEQVEELVAARVDRQQILAAEEPPLLWVVMDEWVLHRQVGTAATMRKQLDALLKAAEQPNVTIQIVPVGAQITGLTGAFTIADSSQGVVTVYLESAREGQVTERPEDVEAITDTWDAIRAKALTDDASMELIAQVMEQKWT